MLLVIKKARLKWFGHVEHKDNANWVKCCVMMEVDVTRQRGSPRKTWWDCEEYEEFGNVPIECTVQA